MDDDVMAMAAAEAAKPKTVGSEAVGIVGQLARQQVDLEDEIVRLEAVLSEKKKELRLVQEQNLPEAMDAIGMKKFQLQSGFEIQIKPYYSASIPIERKDEAYEWLEKNNHDDIIKCKVEVKFEKGEYELAQEFVEFIRGWNTRRVEPDLTRGVHPQTLKAFVKGEVESGANLPHELFGVFIGRQAKIKRT